MYTCSQLATALSKRILILHGKETRQLSIHTAKQVHVWIAFQTKYKTGDKFIFSSYWLISPRFELRNLAGYNEER